MPSRSLERNAQRARDAVDGMFETSVTWFLAVADSAAANPRDTRLQATLDQAVERLRRLVQLRNGLRQR